MTICECKCIGLRVGTGARCFSVCDYPTGNAAGVDFEAAARLGVRVIWALSLPGKTAPVTAGESIKNTIYNMLSELGV